MMKLTIELNDETLNRAIGAQLQATVSRLVHERIEDHVKEIMDLKLSRVDNVIEKAAIAMLQKQFNRHYAGIDRYIQAAALAVIKEKLK